MSDDTRQFMTFATPEEPFPLVSGASLPEVTLAYETWGHLTARRDNVVWITTGLSASSHVARHHPADEPGWWDGMVGPRRPIDTERWFVVCSNLLGGCFGSTGPPSHPPGGGRPYGADFPTVAPEDMVEAQLKLLDHLGIEQVHNVVGASLGGMLALQWGAQHPERVVSVSGIATPGRSHAFSIAWRAVQRQVVMSDAAWRRGRYEPGQGPVQGLTRARAIGILSYRSHREFDPRFGRDFTGRDPFDGNGQFAVERYLQHNAAKFGRVFDANSYLVLARAMDLFDLGRGSPSYEDGVGRITCPVLLMGFTSDLLFPIEQQREVSAILRSRGRSVRLEEVETDYGHDAFLIEVERVGSKLAGFLDSVDPARSQA